MALPVAAGLLFLLGATKAQLPYQDPKRSPEERAHDLVTRLTREEKLAQVQNGGTDPAPGISRLGIPPFQWGNECLAGGAEPPSGPTTAFPQALGLASTFDSDVMHRVAQAIGREVRAKNNDYVARGVYDYHSGVACFSPVINIFRDGRWGRGQETYGECPYLTGHMAKAYVTGLQGNHPKYMQALAGCKHYAVHAGPEDGPISRFELDAQPTHTDMHVTFLPAWKACVEAKVQSVMCAYSSVYGVPACASKYLLQDVLRDGLGFEGYVVSDEGALEVIATDPEHCPPNTTCHGHRYVKTYTEAAGLALEAGTDLELHPGPNGRVFNMLGEALDANLTSETALDRALMRLFRARVRLGDLDPPEGNPYRQIPLSVVDSDEHRALALEAATKSLVLLKNTNNSLPVAPAAMKGKTIAIFGAHAVIPDLMRGSYRPLPSFVVTPEQSIRGQYVDSPVVVMVGCDGAQCDARRYNQQRHEVQAAARACALCVVAVGLSPQMEAETSDRQDFNLPGAQLTMALDVANSAPAGSTVVIVVYSAGPLAIGPLLAHPKIAAILHHVYPGQAAGTALAQVLAGEHSPAGRLAVTWPTGLPAQPLTNYSMQGRTYRYASAAPLLPFGYGLAYTTFHYSDLQVGNATVTPCQGQQLAVTVTNVGEVAGDEVIQVYVSWGVQAAGLGMPQRQLAGARRVFLKPQQSTRLSFDLRPDQLALYSKDQWVLVPGPVTVAVGGQQPDQQVAAPSNVLRAQFTIYGSTTPMRTC